MPDKCLTMATTIMVLYTCVHVAFRNWLLAVEISVNGITVLSTMLVDGRGWTFSRFSEWEEPMWNQGSDTEDQGQAESVHINQDSVE